MTMHPRVLKWQELAKARNGVEEDYEIIRRESIRLAEEEQKAAKTQQLVGKVPLRFRNKSFSDYVENSSEQIRVKNIAERFVSTFDERLEQGTCGFFLGNPGTGKTFLSLIMYQALAQAGYSAHYESTLQFLKTLQTKRFESEHAFKSIMNFYKSIQFLVLDEISESISKNGYPSEYEQKMLFEIVNARYEKKELCTLIISNRDKAELLNRLGQPILDRLSEKSVTLIFDWESYRTHTINIGKGEI